MRFSSFVSLAFLLVPAACKVDPPEENKTNPDAGPSNLPRPQVMAPDETPLSTVAIRGRADGASRIVIKNLSSNTSSVNPLLPGGDFCVEIDLGSDENVTFQIYGVAEDGNISEPTVIEVAHDSSAAPPADPTCRDSGECAAEENCGNDGDDDCNGLPDECDPGCNGCEDDYLEPNDTPFSVPMVTPDTYNGLKICPCREDWYAFLVGEGGRINVSVAFDHDEIDIDLNLYTADAAEDGSDAATVAYSRDSDNLEEIDYTSTGPNHYYLRVFSFRADGQGDYTLTVRD